MKIGEFIKANQTTRDTIRYYITENLLTPIKVNGYYYFSSKEQADFLAVKELRELGFSIKGIKEVQANRVKYGCGTKEQHQQNYLLVQAELSEIESNLALLKQRQGALTELLGKFQLE